MVRQVSPYPINYLEQSSDVCGKKLLTAKLAHQQTTNMSTLFELSKKLENFGILLSEIDDEAQQEILITQYLQTDQDIKTKLEGYCGLIRELETRAEVRKAEAIRLNERASVDSNLAKRLKAMLLWYLTINDIKKVETIRYQISRAKNGGKQPLVINESIPVTTLDSRFQKVTVDYDREAIRQAIENGENIDFAYLESRTESVRIK